MELKNINEIRNIIEEVKKGSIAQELDIKKGDILLSIDDMDIKDIIDYKYLMANDFIVLCIEKDGEIWEYEIEKDYDEDIGIIFSNPLIDVAKSCKNKCSFCFIDQLPKGMRETLYFKDDDSRLSFLQGNFITLTNMSDEDIERIINYRISPINISVHTTDSDLRVKMLKNKNAGKVYDILKRFSEANIDMNCQIVLCPGINDKENLNKTLDDLVKLYPQISSVAVVPVGLTKYRDGLEKLELYDYEKAVKLVNQIEEKQKIYLKDIETRFVYASDEFYLVANKDIPSFEEYEEFQQIENGVGLLKIFEYEIIEVLKKIKNKSCNKRYIIATGTLAYKFMNKIAKMIMDKINGLHIEVVPIVNDYFGDTITVAGLVTGNDLIKQLENYKNFDGIIIPESMLRSGEKIFLDDITVTVVEEKLKNKVIVSKVNGEEFIKLF